MGLLDALFSGDSGSGGGLLDFLRQNGLNQNTNTGIGSNDAGYAQGGMQSPLASMQQPSPIFAPQQPSPLDGAQWPAGPIGAPMQANAQMPPASPLASAVPPAPIASPPQNIAPAPAPASPLGGAAGFFNRLGDGFQSVAQGGSLQGAITGNYTDSKTQAANVANVTARALIAKGVDPQIAIAAVQPGNAEFLKTLVTQNFGQAPHSQETDKDGNVWDVNTQTGQRTIALAAKDDKFQPVKTKDALGAETNQTFNTKTGEYSTPSGTPANGAPSFGSLLAQGVTYDPNKSGDEYMAQFGPEVQAAAKAYIHGDVMPSGNARMNAIATFAKNIAQKWGQDKGIPVNDSTYSGKRMMATQLASSSNSSMGGILSNGESSFSHLAEATGSMADLGNASHDFPFGGVAAHTQNYIGNAAGGSNTKAKILATIDNLGKYGAESTKFYAGTGGGVEERTAARKDVDPNVVSGEEMASFAEKEKSLMLDRLNTKFQQIRDTYGEDEGNAIIAKHMPQIQQNIATIDANVAKMRGAAPANAATAPGGNTTKNGVSWSVVK